VVLIALNLIFTRPDAVGGSVTITTTVVVLVIFAAIALSALSLVGRYRRASGLERQQLKWFALAAGLGGAFVVGQVLSFFVGQLLSLNWLLGDTLWNLLGAAAETGLFLAAGVAILRYRLYDIDTLINRTLVYGVLTVTLALIYFGGVATTQTIFRALTGQEHQPQLAIVVSTLVIAAIFNPLRHRIQSFIDRRFYRRKYDAAKTLEAFSTRLRDETDLETLNNDVVGVVREAIQPTHVSLWLRPDPGSKQNREVEP
jgi:hypothetical protein